MLSSTHREFNALDETKTSLDVSGRETRFLLHRMFTPRATDDAENCLLVVLLLLRLRLLARCGHPRCTTRASFGADGSKKAEFCSRHARDGMVDIYSTRNRCLHPSCTTRAHFGVEGNKKGEFCSEHAKPGMVDFRNKKRGRDSSSSVTPRGAFGATVAEQGAGAWAGAAMAQQEQRHADGSFGGLPTGTDSINGGGGGDGSGGGPAGFAGGGPAAAAEETEETAAAARLFMGLRKSLRRLDDDVGGIDSAPR